jgi:hypothetical protein
MKFERRIRKLGSQLIADPPVLHFTDGSTRKLPGPGDSLLRLFRGVFGRVELSAGQAGQLDLIRKCVGAEEPGGGHMVELLQVFVLAQADARGDR